MEIVLICETMSYDQIPSRQIVSAKDFIKQMNAVIEKEGYLSEGYEVSADANGYWLEKNGVKVVDIEASTILNSTRLRTGIK